MAGKTPLHSIQRVLRETRQFPVLVCRDGSRVAANKTVGTETTSSAKAHQRLKSLRLTVEEYGDLPDQRRRRTSCYTESDMPSFISCGNPRCRRDGYDFGSLLLSLTRAEETLWDEKWYCGGREGSPEGRATGAPCTNFITYSLKIDYR